MTAADDPGTDAAGERDAAESGKAAFMRALDVPRNAKLGFGFGVLFTAAVFTVYVAGPAGRLWKPYYLALAFVLAAGLGGLTTTALTVVSAYRLSKDL